MRTAGILALIAGAALGGWWMWRRTTATLHYRSPNPTIRPRHVRPQDYDRWALARRKRWRLLRTTVAALAGAGVAGMLFVMIDSGVRGR